MEKLYDPVKQPTLHMVAMTSEHKMISTNIETLLGTLAMIDRMAERVQEQFVAHVCLTDDDGTYLNNRADMLRDLVKAIRRAGIRLEQVPPDLRDDAASILAELEMLRDE